MLSPGNEQFALTTTAINAFGVARIFDYNKYHRKREPMRHLMIRVPAVWCGAMIASLPMALLLVPQARADLVPLEGSWLQTILFLILLAMILYVASVILLQLGLWAFWSPIVIGAAFAADTSVWCTRIVNRTCHRGIEAIATVNARKVERVAGLAAFLLPRSIRQDLFETAFEELREDFADYRKRFRSPSARAFLSVCFILKVTLLYLDCLRVWGLDKFIWLIPPAIRMLWRKP